MRMTAPSAALVIALLAAVLPVRAADAPAGAELALQVGKEAVYPGEKVPVMVTLRVTGSALRNVGYPSVPVRGLSLAPFRQPQQSKVDSEAGESTVYRFDTSMTASAPGRKEVGPARLECEVLESAQGQAAFFGEVSPRRIAVSSPAAAVTVLPFPTAGRPTSFSGAVGTLTLSVVAKPETVRVGDPVTITTTATSGGALPADCPKAAGAGWISHPPRTLERGERLICEQVLVPAAVGSSPSVEAAFFVPGASSYRTVSRVISGVTVLPAKPGPLATRAPAPRPTVTAPTPAAQPSAALLATAVGVIAAGCLLFRTAGKGRDNAVQRVQTGHPDAQKQVAGAELAARRGDAEQCYRCILSALQEVMAPFTAIPAAAICSLPPEAGVANGAVIEALFSRCDSVRYGKLTPSRTEMETDLGDLRAILTDIHPPCKTHRHHADTFTP